jgi:hypothetical protein
MKIRNATIIEIARDIKTRTGSADLFKAWDEDSQVIASVWSDGSKPNPFLKGKKVGDSIRLVEEVREEVGMDGKTSERVFYSVLPSAPAA